MIRQTTLVAIVTLALGCGSDIEPKDEEPWVFGENGFTEPEPEPDPEPEPEPQPEPRPEPEPEPDPDPEPEPEPEPDPDRCFEAGLELVDDTVTYRERYFTVVGNRVFVSAVPANQNDTDVFEWDGANLQPFSATPDLDDNVIDGTEDGLWVNYNGVLARYNLSSGTRIWMTMVPESAFPQYNFFMKQPRRQADGTNFILPSEWGMLVMRNDEVDYLDTGTDPWLRGDTAVWIRKEVNTPWRLIILRGDQEDNYQSQTPIGSPVVSDDGVVHFLETGAVKRMELDQFSMWSTTTPLDGRNCGPLHTDGETVVTGCNPDGEPYFQDNYLTLRTNEIWVIGPDGSAERIATVQDETYAFGPVVSERWIAWTEYDYNTSDSPFPLGDVRVYDRDTGQIRTVARMGQGCQTCGAYWPPPKLMIGDDTLVFSYAVDPATGTMPVDDRLGYIGVVRLRDTCE